MKAITLYIGLDVHKDSITIAIAESGLKGEIRIFGTFTNDLHALEKALMMLVSGAPPLALEYKQTRNRRVHCTSRVTDFFHNRLP